MRTAPKKDAAAVAKCVSDLDTTEGTCASIVKGNVCTAKSGSAIEACAKKVGNETCTDLCGKPVNGFQYCSAGTCAFVCMKYATSQVP